MASLLLADWSPRGPDSCQWARDSKGQRAGVPERGPGGSHWARDSEGLVCSGSRVPVAALLRGREGPRPPVPVSQSDQISRADPSSCLKGDIFGRHRKCPTMPGRSNYAQFRFGRFSTETYPRPIIWTIDAKLSTKNTYLLMHFIWTKYLYFLSLALVRYPTHVLGMCTFSEQ